MKIAFLLLAAVAAIALWRRRGIDTTQVRVTWRDGGEATVGEGTPAHERLVAIAGRTLA
jgi:hypothetical protein